MKTFIVAFALLMSLLSYFSYKTGYVQAKHDILQIEYSSDNVELLLKNDMNVCKITTKDCVLDSVFIDSQTLYKIVPKHEQLPF